MLAALPAPHPSVRATPSPRLPNCRAQGTPGRATRGPPVCHLEDGHPGETRPPEDSARVQAGRGPAPSIPHMAARPESSMLGCPHAPAGGWGIGSAPAAHAQAHRTLQQHHEAGAVPQVQAKKSELAGVPLSPEPCPRPPHPMDLLLYTVRSCHDPLRGDDGAPADVGALHVQADLPGPVPRGRAAPAHDPALAHRLSCDPAL